MDTSLHLDWCSYEAANYAVKNWHYSKVMPSAKTVKIGVWENDKFIGVVIFSRGANNNIARPFGLTQNDVCELTRIALTNHANSVTKIVKIALSMFNKKCPGVLIIVSYADPRQGHRGGIYRGGNWIYCGETSSNAECIVNGKRVHKKTINSVYGSSRGFQYTESYKKHKFIWVFDKELRAKYRERYNCNPAGEGVTIRPARSISK